MKRRKFLSSGFIATLPISSLANLMTIKLQENELVKDSKDESDSRPLAAQYLHNELKRICGTTKIGCAINTNWLIGQTLSLLKESSVKVALTKLNLQTSHPKIAAGISIETATINLTILNNKIYLSGFNPTVILNEVASPNGTYNKIQIKFDNVELRLDYDFYEPDKLKFYINEKKPQFKIPDKLSSLNESVITRNGMAKTEFLETQDILLLGNNPIALLDRFVSSIEFPKLLESMKTFSIQSPYKYEFIQNYIIIYNKDINITTKDECAGTDGFRTNVNLAPSLNTLSNGDSNFEFKYTRTLTSLAVPTDRLREVNEILAPDFAFYYPKQLTFQPFINNVITPAISIGDSGSFLAFEWFYKATANLMPGFPIINIDVPTKTMQIDWPLELLGGAGVGIKIACVYVPIASVLVNGDVKPNHVDLTLKLTVDGNGISLYAKPDYNASAHIKFQGLPFVDVLANILMGSLGNKLVSNAMKNAANRLNFKLFDFTNAEIASKFGWIFSNTTDSESIIASFRADNG